MRSKKGVGPLLQRGKLWGEGSRRQLREFASYSEKVDLYDWKWKNQV